jgi:hypothetical protein
MRYYLDTEFIEDGRTIDLISIGIVAEDGREYYAVSAEFNESKASDWVRANVLPHVGSDPRKKREQIRSEIVAFVGASPGKPRFWGYYADYDWVALCQLFGRMIDLPKGWPMYCCDLKQMCATLGDPELPKQTTGEHHALADARWNAEMHDFLLDHREDMAWLLKEWLGTPFFEDREAYDRWVRDFRPRVERALAVIVRQP